MWRVYYGDGSTYQGDPYEAPALNCACIVMAHEEVGRCVVAGKDYYWYEDGQWWGGDQVGFYDYMFRPGPKKVLFGRSLNDRDYLEICKKARQDPDFTPVGAPEDYKEII